MNTKELAHIAGQLEIEANYLDSLCMTNDSALLRSLAQTLYALHKQAEELTHEAKQYLDDLDAMESLDIDDLHNYLDDAVKLVAKITTEDAL